MKHISILLLALAGLLTLAACGDSETYADKRKRERAIISQYLIDQHIKAISEAQFKAQGYTTDTLQHEFVMFENSGVYMQIMRPGVGNVLGKNESANVLVRYTERNLLTDSITMSNEYPNFVAMVDVMTIRTQSGTPHAQFISGTFKAFYNTEKVPDGWLVALPYVKLGGLNPNGVAKIKLIVPSTQGTAVASGNVTPSLFTISFQRES